MVTELTQEQLLEAVMALEARSERMQRQAAFHSAEVQLAVIRSELRVSGWRFALRFFGRRRKYLRLVEIEIQANAALVDALDAVEEST